MKDPLCKAMRGGSAYMEDENWMWAYPSEETWLPVQLVVRLGTTQVAFQRCGLVAWRDKPVI